MKDHLPYKTTFCGPMSGLKSQVSLYILNILMMNVLKISGDLYDLDLFHKVQCKIQTSDSDSNIGFGGHFYGQVR